ncbi:MAG: glutaredoxin family protein [Halobacteriales archaeon]
MAAHEVTVLARDECHLCDEAVETIERVVSDLDVSVVLKEVDVDAHPSLAEVYGTRVPYVLVDGRPKFKYRVDEASLRSLLAE